MEIQRFDCVLPTARGRAVSNYKSVNGSRFTMVPLVPCC
jgi:hypothetical protein